MAVMGAPAASDILACYVPADSRDAMARGEALPSHAAGSALFADVSGFTPLTEALVEKHGVRRGAEQLTLLLNHVYDALITEVDRFGGSVIGFSGDAITCWFGAAGGASPDGVELEGAALRAITCADAMLAAMRRFASVDEAGEPVALGIKVGIATGPARRLCVGDPGIQLHEVLCGATVSRMAACERAAEVGEVVVDESTVAAAPLASSDPTWRAVGDAGVRVAALGSPSVLADPMPWRSGAAPALDLLRRWAPRDVAERILLGHGEFVTELRQTVALFIGFEGIDYDADRAQEKLDGFVRWVQHVLGRFDALLVDVTVGDKGTYLYASFGAQAAHEDDAARAAAAALELRVSPPELDFVKSVRIGISRGTMRAGTVGGGSRRAYAVLGDEVNLAARLMLEAGGGEVLVSGRVRDSLGESFSVEARPVVKVKGKSAMVPIYRLEGAGASSNGAPHASLVGRAEELRRLEAALDRLFEGGRAVVVVEGEPGLGKSRLVEELTARAWQRGAVTYTGAGESAGQSTLFHAWRPVFGAVFEPVDEPDAQVRISETLASLAGEAEVSFSPLLAPVLPVPVPDNDATAGLTGQVRADRRLALLVDVLAGVARRAPTVLVLEDAHWLDTASWALAQRVARRVAPLLLVLATRPGEGAVGPELSELLADPATDRIVLEPLAADDVLEIVRQRLGASSLPDAVAGLITEKAEGNPFFGEELASALRDEGVIAVADGDSRLSASLDELRRLDLPETVQGVITSRIDRLSPSQKLAIRFASVIGRAFSVRTLQEIHPVPQHVSQLHDDLDVLAELQLTQLVGIDGDPTYVFKHAITHEVAYNTLLYTQRAQLHRAVAEWHEREHTDNLAPHYAVLAQHWRHALDAETVDPAAVERALEFGQRAGEQALRNDAHVEATEEFRHVIEVLGQQPSSPGRDRRELVVQTMLGYSLMNQRGYGDSDVEAAYRRAHELTATAGVVRSPELGPLLYGLLSYYSSRAEYVEAAAVAGELLALGEELGDPQVALIGHNAAGLTAILRGELEAGREHTDRSYRLADVHQDQGLMLRYGGDFRGYPRAWLSTAECLLGFPDRAQQTFEEALAVTRDHPYTYAFMLTFGITPLLRADLAATLAYSDELSAVAERYGFVLLTLVANIHRGWALALQGSDEGLGLIAGSLPVIRAVKLDSFVPFYLGLFAEAQLEHAQIEDAEASLDEADRYVEEAEGSFYASELARLRARLLTVQGDFAGAETQLRRAVVLAREQGARWWELRAAVDLARLGKGDAASEARAEVARILETFPEGLDTADVVEARALLARPSDAS
jgi:class 3 adenylate cyclase/tetratricopeptide (TPR) repeat protein